MTATFSTSESASLDREIELESNSSANELSDIWTPDRLQECQEWILANAYKKVRNNEL